MERKLIVNVTEYETRVAILENGTIAELYIERMDGSEITGNIYKGRVQRVLPGMQAAFVEIGLDHAAFIYVDDIVERNYMDYEKVFRQFQDAAPSVPLNNNLLKQACHIGDLIKEGQEIMVQVSKSPMGTKGARVTSHISLPGYFLVFMPTSDNIGVSRRIEDESERKRLKELLTSLRGEDRTGYIVRTSAEGVGEDKLRDEMKFLKNIWKSILEKFRKVSAPYLLHRELNVILRTVRDLMIYEAQKLIIDSRTDYETVLTFLETFMPSLKDSVELYDNPEPIFDAYNLEGDICRALNRKIWLKSGGYIIIEQTEALIAIDVNTGRYVGKHNLEETILKTNLEAVKEIAYQIRLRDIGGIIVIDFIDMEKKANQDKVFNALKEALKKDRSKTNVLPMTEMGLIQMTRKRVRKPITQTLCEPCFYCEGERYQLSRETICHNIYREIIAYYRDQTGQSLTLTVNAKVAEMFHTEKSHLITSLEKITGKQIVIYPSTDLYIEQFNIIENIKRE